MKRNQVIKILYSLGLILIIIILHLFRLLQPLENILAKSINPLLSGFYSIGTNISTVYNRQVDKRNLQNSIAQLQVKANQLSEENVKLKMLEEENKTLREHLKFYSENKHKYVLANIISRGDLDDPNHFTQTIYLDKGSRDGLRLGLAVLNSQGIIVGKIFGVHDNFSLAALTISDKCKLAATIQNSNRTSGVAEGDLGLTIKMKFIPQTESIKVNDTVITSGLERDIPRGLIIGTITQVSKDSNELWQTASLDPLIDLESLVVVSVLIP